MRSKLVIVFLLLIIFLHQTALTTFALGGSESASGFESNEFLPGLDIWINQTNSPFEGSHSPYEGGVAKGSVLAHYFVVPDSVDFSDWEIYDEKAMLVKGLFGKELVIESSGIVVSADDKTEIGLTHIGGRLVEEIGRTDVNQATGIRGASNTVFDMQYEYFNSTTSFDDFELNYTVPENNINAGLGYDALESKSINDYGESLALSQGETLIEVHNATMFGYAYQTFDRLKAVAWTFDQEIVQSPSEFGLNTIADIIQRGRVWIKSYEEVDGSWGRTNEILDLNKFIRFGSVSSSMVGRPPSSEYFHSLQIPSSHFDISKVGVSASTEGIRNNWRVLVIILVGVVGLLILMYYYSKKNKGF